MSKIKIILSVLVLFFLVGLFAIPTYPVSAATTTKLKVNNTVLEYNKVIYVDGTHGDDTNGDGSNGKPFKFNCQRI